MWFGFFGDMGNDYMGLCWILYFIKDFFFDGLIFEFWCIREWFYVFMFKSKYLVLFI